MGNFDYENDSVVGVLTIDNKGNGHIRVYGYFHTDSFIPLEPNKAKTEFKPKGEVYAFKAADKYYNLGNTCVKLKVIPNQKEDDGRRDAFMWDYTTKMESCGREVVHIKKVLDGDGKSNHSVLEEYNLFEDNASSFVLSNSLVYCLEDDSSEIPYCNMEDVNLFYYKDSDRWFSVDDCLPHVEGYIDIMDDQALVDWFVNKVLKSSMWKKFKDGNKQEVMGATKEAMNKLSIPHDIMESRIHRLENFTDTFLLTLDAVKSLTDKPWFGPTIKETLSQNKEELLNELVERKEDVINARKEARLEEIAETRKNVNKELEELRQTLDDKKEELSRIREELKEKKSVADQVQQKLEQIDSKNREAIEGLQDVSNTLNPLGQAMRNVYHLESIDLAVDNTGISDLLSADNIFQLNMQNCLSKLKLPEEQAKEITALLKSYKVILLPGVQMVMALLYAMGRCSYLTTYVSVSWKSFTDLWIGGLNYIVQKSNDEPEQMHFLVLRNINLSCIPNYLQPVFDLQSALIRTFPGTDIAFPRNLRIVATASADTLIPMTAYTLRQMGCARKNNEITVMHIGGLDDIKLVGYVTPEGLIGTSLSTDDVNHYEDYVDE